MKIYITKNANGFMFIWLEEPNRNKYNNWSGKFFLIDSILYNKTKEMLKDIDFTSESEPIIMSY